MIIDINEDFRINGDRYQIWLEERKIPVDDKGFVSTTGEPYWLRVSGYYSDLSDMIRSFSFQDLFGDDIVAQLDDIKGFIDAQNDFIKETCTALNKPLKQYMKDNQPKRGRKKER